jgi:hypothetical protein
MDWSMTYNSDREELIIPEYGRHVQDLIKHAKTIENDQERQRFVEEVVGLMIQIQSAGNRSADDLREKIWKHVFRIADYELDVTPPNGEQPSPEAARLQPEVVGYPEYEAKYRHYGHNVQRLIKRALEMPEGAKRDGFVAVIGAYMKLAYKTWNKEHYVSDEVIKADLESLSGGALKLDEDLSLENLGGPSAHRRPGGPGNMNQGGKRRPSDRDRDRDRGSQGSGGHRGGQRNNRQQNNSRRNYRK